jgi:hypothetical protein
MADAAIDLRQEQRRRIEADLERVRRMARLQILDRSEADALIVHFEDALTKLRGTQ